MGLFKSPWRSKVAAVAAFQSPEPPAEEPAPPPPTEDRNVDMSMTGRSPLEEAPVAGASHIFVRADADLPLVRGPLAATLEAQKESYHEHYGATGF